MGNYHVHDRQVHSPPHFSEKFKSVQDVLLLRVDHSAGIVVHSSKVERRNRDCMGPKRKPEQFCIFLFRPMARPVFFYLNATANPSVSYANL